MAKGESTNDPLGFQMGKGGEDEWLFEITANAFLYHMVRRMVFLLVETVRERLLRRTLSRLFKPGKKSCPGWHRPTG